MYEQLRGESVDVTEGIGMKHSNHLLDVGCRTSPPRRVSAGCASSGVALLLRERTGVGAAPRSSAMRPLVSRIAYHRKGARRASICSSMSGDIGVDAGGPAQRVREQELVMVGEMPGERSGPPHFVALPG